MEAPVGLAALVGKSAEGMGQSEDGVVAYKEGD